MNHYWQQQLSDYTSKRESAPPILSRVFENEICFYDLAEGYQRLEQSDCILPLTQMAFVRVVGKDAQAFLQGQFTCDIHADVGRWMMGAHCSAKGKVQNFFRIICCTGQRKDNSGSEPDYLLMFHRSTLTDTLARLKKYAMFSKVQMIDETGSLAAFACNGSNTQSYLSAAFQIPTLDIQQTFHWDNPYSLLIRLRAQTQRFLLIAPVTKIQHYWQTCLDAFQANNSHFWQLLEIRSGIPIIYQETADLFFPHYLNLPALNAVSFEKGCYLGQEVVARMQYRGKVNKHLHRALAIYHDTLPKPGTLVKYQHAENAQPVGTIVSASPTSDHECELLLVLHDEYQHFEKLYTEANVAEPLHHLNLAYT